MKKMKRVLIISMLGMLLVACNANKKIGISEKRMHDLAEELDMEPKQVQAVELLEKDLSLFEKDWEKGDKFLTLTLESNTDLKVWVRNPEPAYGKSRSLSFGPDAKFIGKYEELKFTSSQITDILDACQPLFEKRDMARQSVAAVDTAADNFFARFEIKWQEGDRFLVLKHKEVEDEESQMSDIKLKIRNPRPAHKKRAIYFGPRVKLVGKLKNFSFTEYQMDEIIENCEPLFRKKAAEILNETLPYNQEEELD